MREFVVIDFYAVIQINVNALIRERVNDVALPVSELSYHRAVLICLAVVGGAVALLELADLSVNLFDVLTKVLG